MRKFIAEVYSIWVHERPTQLAAALAYYSMFSLAPIIYLAVRIAGLFIDQFAAADRLYENMQKILGPQIAALLRDLVVAASNYERSGTFLVTLISFLSLCFAASGLFYQLQFALNTVWRVPVQKGYTKGFIRKYMFSFLMVIGVSVLLIIATLMNVIITWFGSLLEILTGSSFSQNILAWVTALGITALSFGLLYKILPDARIAWLDVWPGAFTAAFLVMVAATLASFYFSLGIAGSALEAVGAFSVLVMAIYYMAQIFLLGAVITRVFAAMYGSGKPKSEPASQQLAAGKV